MPSTVEGTRRGGANVLALIHPEGIAPRVLVIGGNCPARLCPDIQVGSGARADLIIVAPTNQECRTKNWLRDTATAVCQQLDVDGIAYVLVPRRWRRKQLSLLLQNGLVLESRIAHLPDWESSCYLVPLQSHTVCYALHELLPTGPWKKRASALALASPVGASVLSMILPWAALLVRRPGHSPSFSWLLEQNRVTRVPQHVILGWSLNESRSSVVLHCLAERSKYPSLIAKATRLLDAHQDSVSEVARLSELGPKARNAGAIIPYASARDTVGAWSLVVENAIPGRSAAALVAARPNQLPRVIHRLVTWLTQWNLATREFRNLDGERVQRILLKPAHSLAALLPDSEPYQRWLKERCAHITDCVPLTAAHNDLTMWNVLVDDQEHLGIVDWETASADSFPLVDFFYAMTSAVSVAEGVDYYTAFLNCFGPGGRYERLATELLTSIKKALLVPDGFEELCLHACFLYHAVNAQKRRGLAQSDSFVKIIQWLAAHRTDVEQ